MKKKFKIRLSPTLKKVLKLMLLFLMIGIILVLAIFVYYAKDLPRPESFTERPFTEPTRIYDRTGKVVLYTIYGEEKRELVSIENIPEHLKQAVIITEDNNFYKHFGVDPKGIGRAVLVNLKIGGRAQGGSTITQQLIRSSFLSGEKTIKRKIREVILTIELERRYEKDKILEFYLNQIPFGSNAYGVESASQTFFNKPVSEITISEAAILAALIKSPSRLSPYGDNIEDLFIRRDYILDKMFYEGAITEEELHEAKNEEIKFHSLSTMMRAPHFIIEIKKYLEEKYGDDYLRTKGLKVYTTIDWEIQDYAEKTIKEYSLINQGYNCFNSSLVAINPKTGEVLAMVGSIDYFKDPYPANCIPGKNCLFEPYPNVSMRERQPGSAFKPFVYADAFSKGFSADAMVEDEPINIGGYSPQNYDGLFRGPVTLRVALAQSLNVPSVKVLAYFSNVEDSIKLAKKMGITTLNRPASFYGLPLVLGGGEVRLLDMVSAFGTFATEGYSVPYQFINKIVDSQGNIIEENKTNPRQVMNSSVARTINDILSDNEARGPMFGYNSELYIPEKKVSVKTGTTQNFKDGWTIGYNSEIVVGVWSGNNNGTPMVNAPGGNVSAPIWNKVIRYSLGI